MNYSSYSLAIIQEKARQLVEQGFVTRHQRIYKLWQYIPAREWMRVERELGQNDLMLKDCLGDLIGWDECASD